MHIIDIVPTNSLHLVTNEPMQMFLTHLVLSNKTYAEWAKNYKGYKILDNSLIENHGRAIDITDVLKAAEIIHADEIILPDVFSDGQETLKKVDQALKRCKDVPYKLMAVVHGKDYNEWIETFRCLDNYEEIDTLGIPKVCTKLSPKGRADFENIWLDSSKEIHLLGLWYSFAELKDLKNPERVRSVDTCQLAYLSKYHMEVLSVRPDGFTLNLDRDHVDPYHFNRLLEERKKCLNL